MKIDNPSYSKREAELIRLIARRGAKRITLDYLCEHYPIKEGAKHKNLRSSIASSMRHIEWKSHAADEPVVRKITGRGRGEKAEYEVLHGAKSMAKKLKGSSSTSAPGRSQR